MIFIYLQQAQVPKKYFSCEVYGRMETWFEILEGLSEVLMCISYICLYISLHYLHACICLKIDTIDFFQLRAHMPRLYTQHLIPSRQDWKIVDWDVKPQPKQKQYSFVFSPVWISAVQVKHFYLVLDVFCDA